VHILSFEKPDKLAEGGAFMRVNLEKSAVGWTPLSFTRRFGKIGKGWDLLRMYMAALALVSRHQVGIVHCRSYQAMQVGVLLRCLFDVRTIFDMRGLWVDERLDGDLWPQDQLANRLAYRWYKRVEASLPELHRLSPTMRAPVTVIPCCADFEHFMAPVGAKERIRRELGITGDDFLLSYLGSLGTWYMLEEMLQFFRSALRLRGKVHLLLVTRDWSPACEALIDRLKLRSSRSHIHVRCASREDVPELIASSDVMLSFIKPAYSKIASSPTKLAEAFALGIPVISNKGIGDVDSITVDLDAGALVDVTDPDDLERVARTLDQIRVKGGERLRRAARERFGLEIASASYRAVYLAIAA
jgi:glycosyltransferase involved in cell wall biosynthesis